MEHANLLPQPDLSKLAKLCAMFGSDYEGERANAARMANDVLRRNGVTWDQMFSSLQGKEEAKPPKERKARKPRTRTVFKMPADCDDPYEYFRGFDPHVLAEHALEVPEALYEGEEKFLKNAIRLYETLSARQREWIVKIAVRCALNTGHD